MPSPAVPVQTIDLQSEVAAAQAELARAIQLAGLENDPLGHAYRAQSTVIGLFPKLVARMDASRAPISGEDVRQVAQILSTGVVGQVGRAVRVMDRRNVLIAAGILIAVLAVGAAGGYWLHGNAPTFAGVRAGIDRCDDKPDGSQICWIPIWTRRPPKEN